MSKASKLRNKLRKMGCELLRFSVYDCMGNRYTRYAIDDHSGYLVGYDFGQASMTLEDIEDWLAE